jgi:hypothetical protein
VTAAGVAFAASNLVVNGSFDNPDDRLYGWKYTYDREGESWYFDNHRYVSVVARDEGRPNVLRLHGTDALLNVPGQGVKVDSRPIPVVLPGRFRFSVWARSTGPCCRILIEGYSWAPKVSPHPDPELHELRKRYKFSQLYFSKEQEGEYSAVGRAWQRASMLFPEDRLSPLAQACLKEVQFLVVHIVAIAGSEGDLFVDDVTLERIP